MMRNGARFPNQVSSEESADFLRFVRDRDRVHNPWPELADRDDPLTAFANPWARLLYLPTTDPRGLPGRFDEAQAAPLELQVGILHEHLHLALDYTPAKEWCRVCLGIVYAQIGKLFDLPDDQWGDEAANTWRVFQLFSDMLERSVEAITLAEELLATAFSFRAIEQLLLTGNALRRLRDFERECVARQDRKRPGFSRLYYGGSEDDQAGGFAKVARLCTFPGAAFPSNVVLGPLGVFLEAVEVEGKLLRVVDSQQRCAEMVDAIEEMSTPEEFEAWVNQQISGCDMMPWQLAISALIGLYQDGEYPSVGVLWSLARGGKLPSKRELSLRDAWSRLRGKSSPTVTLSADAQGAYQRWPVLARNWVDAEWAQVLLYPQERDGRWFITPTRVSGRVDDEYPALLVTEGFRQQLRTGRGMYCPYLSAPTAEGRCVCADIPELRRTIRRLAHWATVERRFGDSADWRSLGPPCSMNE